MKTKNKGKVNKQDTIGCVGERLFKDFLIDNKLSYIDLRDKDNSHPFDFIVENKNIEVKISRIIDGYICFNWLKNDVENIDYVIGIVLDDEKQINYFVLFDNYYINSHRAFRSNNKYGNYKMLSKNDILKTLCD